MKHAGATALAELAELLAQLRALPGLSERRPGIFYRGSTAFLHFHEDPAGLFADAKVNGGGFERWPVDTSVQQQSLLQAVRQAMADKAARPTAR
jgi:hypothetical protein